MRKTVLVILLLLSIGTQLIRTYHRLRAFCFLKAYWSEDVILSILTNAHVFKIFRLIYNEKRTSKKSVPLFKSDNSDQYILTTYSAMIIMQFALCLRIGLTVSVSSKGGEHDIGESQSISNLLAKGLSQVSSAHWTRCGDRLSLWACLHLHAIVTLRHRLHKFEFDLTPVCDSIFTPSLLSFLLSCWSWMKSSITLLNSSDPSARLGRLGGDVPSNSSQPT